MIPGHRGTFRFLFWLMEPEHACPDSRSKNQGKKDKEIVGGKKKIKAQHGKKSQISSLRTRNIQNSSLVPEMNRWCFSCQ